MRFFCHHELMLSSRLFTGFGEIINSDNFFLKEAMSRVLKLENKDKRGDPL